MRPLPRDSEIDDSPPLLPAGRPLIWRITETDAAYDRTWVTFAYDARGRLVEEKREELPPGWGWPPAPGGGGEDEADGEYMAVENLAVGRFLTFLRHNVWHRKWKDRSPFQGIDKASFDCFSSLFKHLRYRKHHGLVVAINASHPRIR